MSIILGTIYTNFFLVDFSGRKRKLSQHHQKKVKIKRPRTSFNVDQLSILEGEFHQNPYLTESRRKTLAQNLQLDDSQIKARIIYNFPLIEKKNYWLLFLYLFLGGRVLFEVFPLMIKGIVVNLKIILKNICKLFSLQYSWKIDNYLRRRSWPFPDLVPKQTSKIKEDKKENWQRLSKLGCCPTMCANDPEPLCHFCDTIVWPQGRKA